MARLYREVLSAISTQGARHPIWSMHVHKVCKDCPQRPVAGHSHKLEAFHPKYKQVMMKGAMQKNPDFVTGTESPKGNSE